MSTLAFNPSLAASQTHPRVSQPLAGSSKVRLTPRGLFLARLAIVTSLSVLLLSGASLFQGASAGSEESVSTSPYTIIVVQPGQTLWSIAASLTAGGDRRDLVAEIAEVNHLKNPELQAGQKLYIPTR